LYRAGILHDNGLWGGSENVGCDMLWKSISKRNMSNNRPAQHNPLTVDFIIGLKVTVGGVMSKEKQLQNMTGQLDVFFIVCMYR